jgi:WD40 repeat protein
LWDTPSRRKLPPLAESAGRATAVAFDPKGQRLAGSVVPEGETGRVEVRVWNLSTEKVESRIAIGDYTGYSDRLVFSPDGFLLGWAQAQPTFQVWEHKNEAWQQRLKIAVPERVQVKSLTFAQDSKTLITATGGGNGTVTKWNLASGQSAAAFREGHDGDGLTCAVVHPDGSVYSAGHDGRIIHWISQRQKPEVCRLPGAVYHLALTEDGRYLFTANSNGTVYVLRLDEPRN